MKLIAKIDDGRYIAEVSHRELRLIQGGPSASIEFEVGREFAVVDNWMYLERVLKQKKQLLETAKALHTFANMLELMPVITEESLKENTR